MPAIAPAESPESSAGGAGGTGAGASVGGGGGGAGAGVDSGDGLPLQLHTLFSCTQELPSGHRTPFTIEQQLFAFAAPT